MMNSIKMLTVEYELGQLQSALAPKDLAALASCGILQNDVNVLLKLVQWSGRAETSPPEIAMFSLMQRSVLLRMLTLRLCAYIELLRDFKATQSKAGDLAREQLKRMKEIDESWDGAAGLALRIRNQIAAHSSTKDMKTALAQCEAGTEVSAYLAEDWRNSLYSLGEAGVFFGSIQGDVTLERFLSLCGWCYEVAESLSVFHVGLRENLLADLEDSSNVRLDEWPLQQGDFAPFVPDNAPLFVREADT
jgi:hypothetical protein